MIQSTVDSTVSVTKIKFEHVICSISTLIVLGWLLFYCQYGFDFTDESFYLIWISEPFNYSISVTQFGYIYHPLFRLVNSDIVALRQANLLITFGLSWFFSYTFLQSVIANQSLTVSGNVPISATFAISALVYMAWMPTPSYNSLTLQGFLIAASGIVKTIAGNKNKKITDSLLISFGGWLAFMAKPTSAAALAVCSFFFLTLSGNLLTRRTGIALATTICLLVISAYLIDGSIVGFITRLDNGYHATNIFNSAYTSGHIFRLDEYTFSENSKAILTYGIALLTITLLLSLSVNRHISLASKVITMLVATITIAIILRVYEPDLNAGKFQGLLTWIIPFSAVLAYSLVGRLPYLSQLSLNHLVLSITLLCLPHAYAFGTTNNYWLTGSRASIFWLFAGLSLIRPIKTHANISSFLSVLGIASLLITVALIDSGLKKPYRQPEPLFNNNYQVKIGKSNSAVMLSDSYGHYIEKAKTSSSQAGFKSGMPMIDMTGQSPGILYSIGASSIGQAWTIGGYPGSDKLASLMLRKVSCEKLALAWLLVEPDGPRSLSPSILSSFGKKLASDYTVTSSFMTPAYAGGYKNPRLQQILKPNHSAQNTLKACENSRANTQ